MRTNHYFVAALAVSLLAFSLILTGFHVRKNAEVLRVAATASTETTFDAKSLAQYDGTNPNLPIYLALDGFVYDVSAGKEYYQLGGNYHFLAGKDSSVDLHFAGADIIKQKYPVIGVFVADTINP